MTSLREFADGLVRGRLPNLSGSQLGDMGRELQDALDALADGTDATAVVMGDVRAALVDLGALAADDYETNLGVLIRMLFAALKP